jgi:hypothetical protein
LLEGGSLSWTARLAILGRFRSIEEAAHRPVRGHAHDEDRRRILAEIHGQSGADFIADTPLTKYFAREARRSQGNDVEEDQ